VAPSVPVTDRGQPRQAPSVSLANQMSDREQARHAPSGSPANQLSYRELSRQAPSVPLADHRELSHPVQFQPQQAISRHPQQSFMEDTLADSYG